MVYRVGSRNMMAACLAALLMALPMVHAQTTDTTVQEVSEQPGTPITFYGHVFSHGRGAAMPMNTQFPQNEADYSIGNGGGCGNPPPAPDESSDCEAWGSNELFLFTTPGFVQAKSSEEFNNNGGYAMLHNERGQTKDIYLDTAQTVTSTLHMSADFHGWFVGLCDNVCWGWDPGYFQDWTVETWVWAVPLGEAGSGASEEPEMGPVASRSAEGLQLIANGRTEPMDMASFDETLPLDPVCGGTCYTVHEFSADLEWDPDFVAAGGKIAKEHDIVVEFEWYQFTDGQKYILHSGPAGIVWNLNGGEDFPNRVVLPVRNPIDVELVFPTFVHDKLVILSVINTPWGSYDIDTEQTILRIQDASGNEVRIEPEHIQGGVQNHVSHAGHYMPIEGQWIWDYQAQGLKPGEYTVTIETVNFQGSATSSTSATFTINADGKGTDTSTGRSGLQSYDDSMIKDPATEGEALPELKDAAKSKDSPAPGTLVVLALAGLAVSWRRRA